MYFKCSHKWEDGSYEEWTGRIIYFKNYGRYWEIEILSRSSLHLIFGKYSRGLFAVAPEFGGTYLSDRLNDVFYNTERLTKVYNNLVDALTVAKALETISYKVSF